MIGLSSSANAFAEKPAAARAEASGPSASAGGDVVRLKNGGVVRGKISELLPGASVTIVSSTGKTHEFQMREVSYAGPESQEPAAAAQPTPAAAAAQGEWSNHGSSESKPYVTVYGAEAKLHLESNPPGLTFHREESSAVAYGHGGVAHATGYARLCTSPCNVSLPAGTESFALSLEGKSPVSADAVSFPAGESRVVAEYTDNGGIRVAGVIVVVAAVVTGGVLIGTSFKGNGCDGGYCDEPLDTTQFLIGSAVMVGGGLLGFVLTQFSDTATVQVSPNAGPSEAHALLKLPALALRSTF